MVVLPKCGTNPRPSDVFNESNGSENPDSDAVDTALAIRWNKTSPGFQENERNSQKAEDLSCSVSSEMAFSKQNIAIGMGENNFQEDRRNLNRSETENPCKESVFSSYGCIAATNNSMSENGTDNDVTGISSETHGYSLSNSRSENGTDNDVTEISSETHGYSLSNSRSENGTDNDVTGISSAIPGSSLITSMSENGTDNSGSEISSITNIYSLSNNRSDNGTDFYGNEPSLPLREHPQEKNNSNPGLFPGIEDIDHSLIFTCEGRCDEKLSFPCSCTATCVVYGSCCENITQDCPEVWREGWARFEHITRADLVCDENLVYLISSCPNPEKETVVGEERRLANREKPMLKKENVSSPTSSSVSASFNKDFIRIDSSSSAESDVDTQGSLYQRLKKALLLAPVTDSESGLTFSTRAIYDCNNMSKSTALPWSLRLKYDFKSPTALEDFDQRETFNAFQPAFSKQILMDHLCLEEDVINTCKITEGLKRLPADFADKCHKSTSLIYSEKIPHYIYRNIYCAYCNEGIHNSYLPKMMNTEEFKGSLLRVLMSISDSKTFRFTLKTHSSFNPRFIKIPWSSATCSILDDVPPASPGSIVDPASSESDGNSMCSVTCENPRFTLRSDGMCKAKHEALLAVADDGHPRLCPSAITCLAQFILCGLENEIENLKNADLKLMSVSVSFDSSTNKSLHVMKVEMALPESSTLYFSNSQTEIFRNVRDFALLVRAFKEYRLSQNLCSEDEDESQISDLKIISTSSLNEEIMRMSFFKSFSLGMEQLRGPLVNNRTTTTVCLSTVYSSLEFQLYSSLAFQPQRLSCMEDPVYERDRTWLNQFRDSPCFSHLGSFKSGGSSSSRSEAITANSKHGIFFAGELFLRVLVVTTVIRTVASLTM